MQRGLDLARIALASEALGGAEQVLEMTTEYVKQRVQFGRPIGSFQALKHRLADMMVQVEAAKSAAWYAACVADEGTEELAEAAATAKSYCCDAFYDCAASAIQLHGGVGYTWEHDVQLYFKRARASATLLGSPSWQRERLMRVRGGRSRLAVVLRGDTMKLGFTPAEERFRGDVAAWLESQLRGPFQDLRGVTSLSGMLERRMQWERTLGAAHFSCIGWPEEFGGRNATLAEQVIFAEEYARSGAPGRIGHMGVELAGPTILTFGTAAQKARFLPPIARGEEFWCQGYSEPNAGSDLANVRTRAVLRGRAAHGS